MTSGTHDIEIEARFIGLDWAEVEKKLVVLGARKESESFFREWVFQYPEWFAANQRIRVRDDGKNVWMTYKANPSYEIDSTEEIEIAVSSSENASKILKKIGIPLARYQEKKRIQYCLDNAVVDLDFWPKIPMVLEIEALTKERVMEVSQLLSLNWANAIFIDQKRLHKKYYGIDLDAVKEYKF